MYPSVSIFIKLAYVEMMYNKKITGNTRNIFCLCLEFGDLENMGSV